MPNDTLLYELLAFLNHVRDVISRSFVDFWGFMNTTFEFVGDRYTILEAVLGVGLTLVLSMMILRFIRSLIIPLP